MKYKDSDVIRNSKLFSSSRPFLLVLFLRSLIFHALFCGVFVPHFPPQIEVPIPEQFVSKITADGKLLSGVSDLYTH